MRKFRPYHTGYLVLYGLVLLTAGDAIYSAFTMRGGTSSNPFALWSFFLCILAIFYVRQYIPTIVSFDGDKMRVVRPVLITPKPGATRVNFIMRQGDKDNVLIDRVIPLSQVRKYGYIEDLGLPSEDQSGTNATNILFPVHEVAFVLEDGTNQRMNVPIYSAKQCVEIFDTIKKATGVEPMGKLAEDAARGFVKVKAEKKKK